uniref:Neurotransmitter-gated ion-channel transmembrane domain-containing protein n=1 Tax=Lates calcarifer TaxID=8187 RepID=A0A4W6D908_LATCA
MYVVNLLIPSCFLITVDLFSFLLPPQAVDRSSFKMTLILGYTVFLLIMNDLLPITGNTIPLINVFFSLCLALMVASLLETIFITNLLYSSTTFSPVPRWIRVLVLKILGRLVCMPLKKESGIQFVSSFTITNHLIHLQGVHHIAKSMLTSKDSEAPEQRGSLNNNKALEELRSLGRVLQALRLQVEQQLVVNQSSEEWVQVGFVVDHLLFILYILFISVSFITIIIVWVQSNNTS